MIPAQVGGKLLVALSLVDIVVLVIHMLENRSQRPGNWHDGRSKNGGKYFLQNLLHSLPSFLIAWFEINFSSFHACAR
jgi:hypothetical protein